ncbi:hypothetical protein FHS16_003914 [Paenibacillus endophyticus]|uniref:DUF4367 domain-containing protein n=1 Tax=Paenibacillus endophyticus TaxID=1294268 RepID=A0A7W5CAY9_9BACL|nr:hypothetical protein [Paenibacillus endophyticus]MBB3153839.1 hypothetical protein [Paenibacillus endophyticus]
MTDRDHELHLQFRKESDEMLFSSMEMSEHLKRKIRQEAAAEKAGRKWKLAKSWKVAAVGLAAAVSIVVAIPLLGTPSAPAPVDSTTENVSPSQTQTNGGITGSDLTKLTTLSLGSVEEAKASFGEGLLLPSFVPNGYTLTEMAAVGMPGQPVRDIIVTYASGEHTVTFSVSRMASVYPAELFTKTKVGDVDGFVFEQPGMTELFWTMENVHFGVTGPISGDVAMKMALSATL